MTTHLRLTIFGCTLLLVGALGIGLQKYALGCASGYRVVPKFLELIDTSKTVTVLSFAVLILGSILLFVAFWCWRKSKGDALVLQKMLAVLLFLVFLGIVSLASLNCARCAGPDSHLRSLLFTERVSAEIFYYDNNSSYAGFCRSSEMQELIQRLQERDRSQEGLLCAATSRIVCNDSDDAYAISGKLHANSGYQCVDSSGFKEIVDVPLAGTKCSHN